MARFIQPESRQPEWGQYAILKDRLLYPPEDALPDATYPPIWIDSDPNDVTTCEAYKGRYRGLIFQRFTAP
jgi:hypothetical protein